MLENFQYFFYGYPEENQPNMYALYQPVADAFLICTSNCDLAQDLKMLLSSRYSLHLVELTRATNYHHNLIDNTVCEKWSFVEKNLLDINKLPQCVLPVHARTLCSSTGNIDIDWVEEKKYAMMCAHWIEFFNSDIDRKFKSDLNKKFQLQLAQCIGYKGFLQPNDKIKPPAMNLLYSGKDVEATDSSIRKMLNDQ